VGRRDGRNILIEVTELVDGSALAVAKKGIAVPDETLVWSASKFSAQLSKAIFDKQRKYANQAVTIDVLLVHTDDWLSALNVEQWLTEFAALSTPNILCTWLLLTHDDRAPSTGDWAVLKVF
jgi:hypothetical protein